MTQLPNSQQQWNPQHGIGPVPTRSRRRWRFRWGWWVGVPLACPVAAWLLQAITAPAFEWSDVMEVLHVPSHASARYTELCALALTLIAVVAVMRLWRKRKGNP